MTHQVAASTLSPHDGNVGPVTLSLLTLLGAIIIGLTGVASVLVGERDLNGYVIVGLIHGGFYVAASILVWRIKPEGVAIVGLIIGIAVLSRLVAMTAPPNLTTDAYRYVWDGKLILEGINPYLFVPADDALRHLRDAEIYPQINKKEIAHTIYPPMAQMLFALGALISDGLAGQKLVMFACELVIIGCLVGWLRTSALPASLVLLYAWHPLPIWEFSSQAHIDAGVTAFMAAALLAAAHRRQGLAGGLLAAGFLVKYYPIVLVPALWRRWDWRMPTAFFAVVILAYLPFVGEAGTRVVGFLGPHLDDQGYAAGWGFHLVWLLRDFKIADPPVELYLGVSLALLFGLALVTFFRRGREEIQPAYLALLGAAFVFFTSPHYPWYAAFLTIFLVRVPHPALFAITLFAIVLQVPRMPGGLTWTHLYALSYWLPLALWLGGMVWHLRRGRTVSGPDAGIRSSADGPAR